MVTYNLTNWHGRSLLLRIGNTGHCYLGPGLAAGTGHAFRSGRDGVDLCRVGLVGLAGRWGDEACCERRAAAI